MRCLASDRGSDFSFTRATGMTTSMSRLAHSVSLLLRGRSWACVVGAVLSVAICEHAAVLHAQCQVACTKTDCIYSPNLDTCLNYDPVCAVTCNTANQLPGTPAVLGQTSMVEAVFCPGCPAVGGFIAGDSAGACNVLGIDEQIISCYTACQPQG